MPLALSTGHEVGLAVVGAAFILFALASSFLFPRFRPQYPGGGLLAFIVVAVVFFFGMLTAVEVFGADKKEESGGSKQAAQTESGAAEPTTSVGTVTAPATTQKTKTTIVVAPSSTSPAQSTSTSDKATESEFKIALATTKLKAGVVTFKVTNGGKLPHDLSIKGGKKTKLIQPGSTAQLTVTLKPGTYHLYCSVPGHEQAGMKVDVTVS